MTSPVQKIKERLSIEEVVSSYIKVEKAGANLKARCPFHNEKTPSFFISPGRGNYYCFGCGAKGDIFTFVEEFEGLDFKGALKILADKAGVTLETFNREEDKLALSEKEKLYRVMEESAKFFTNNLMKTPEALAYLKSRGLKDETIKDFRIGFVKAEWRELYNYLKTKNFSDVEIEKAGLAKKIEKLGPDGKQGFYDRFRGRVMFPIADSSGRIVAFTGRLFVDDGKSAKYLNSPETPIFSKSSVFYGLDRAKDSIRKNNFSILVEGQFDLILSHQSGFKNTVASSGTALSDSTLSKENVVSNLGLILRLSKNIVLAFDADKAGVKAAERASRIALSLGMDVKVAKMSEGVDPADLISKSGVESWKKSIRGSKHIIEFLLDRILENEDDARKIGKEIKEKILPYVDSLESSIEKSHFIKKISDMSGISEEALKDDLLKVEQELKINKEEIKVVQNNQNKIFRKDYIERRLLGIILWQKDLVEKKIDVEKILKELSSFFKLPEIKLLEKVKDNKEDLIFEAEVFYGQELKLEREVEELMNNLKEEFLKEELFKKMQELRLAELKKDTIKSGEILKEINEINSNIQDIKNGRFKK